MSASGNWWMIGSTLSTSSHVWIDPFLPLSALPKHQALTWIIGQDYKGGRLKTLRIKASETMSTFAFELLASALEHDASLESFTCNESALPIQKLRSRNEEWNTALNTVRESIHWRWHATSIPLLSLTLILSIHSKPRSSCRPGSATQSALSLGTFLLSWSVALVSSIAFA